MRINSINKNNFKISNNNLSFKHTAVPYPEYRNSYSGKYDASSVVDTFIRKMSELFKPEVSKEALVIKNNIDKLYETSSVSPKTALLSVIA